MEMKKNRNYTEMSGCACSLMVDALKRKPDSLFCIATGSSPTEAYRLFVQRVKEENIDTGKMRIIALDEWYGLAEQDPASCEYYIRKHLLLPLHIPDDRFIAFRSQETDEALECGRVAALLKEAGGIDCCILGIGKNGHLGLNEPGEALNPFIHKTELDSKTKGHSMLAASSRSVTCGYTLGLKDILASREILLLITGDGKEEAFCSLRKGMLSSYYPANYLWLHGNTTAIVDCLSLNLSTAGED